MLHLAPHPDDEVIGAPATLLRLRDAGHRVVNLACSLGQPDQHERRRREVTEACRLAGFELLVLDPPLAISRGDDFELAQRRLAEEVRRLIAEYDVALVVAPTPHDGHYGHEVVGRAARDAVAARGPVCLWMWAIWADLPLPTLFCPFDEALLERASARTVRTRRRGVPQRLRRTASRPRGLRAGARCRARLRVRGARPPDALRGTPDGGRVRGRRMVGGRTARARRRRPLGAGFARAAGRLVDGGDVLSRIGSLTRRIAEQFRERRQRRLDVAAEPEHAHRPLRRQSEGGAGVRAAPRTPSSRPAARARARAP